MHIVFYYNNKRERMMLCSFALSKKNVITTILVFHPAI